MSQSPSNTNREQAANRLSIAHLLLWTATTALAVGTIMPDPIDAPFQSDMPAEVRAYLSRQQQQWRMATVLTGPVLGAGLAALVIATWRRWRHQPGFPTQPGHWMLMIVGMCTVAAMDLALVNRLSRFNSNLILSSLVLIFWVTCLVTLILLAVAYFRVSEPLPWKCVFAIAGVNVGLFFFGCCGFPLGEPFPFQLITLAVFHATPISVVVAAVLDVLSGRAHDVFHWVGVVAVPALAVILSGLTFLG